MSNAKSVDVAGSAVNQLVAGGSGVIEDLGDFAALGGCWGYGGSRGTKRHQGIGGVALARVFFSPSEVGLRHAKKLGDIDKPPPPGAR